LAIALFSDLVAGRKREIMSAVGHYIAGVLAREAMVEIIESLCVVASFEIGDRVQTLRGSLHGRVTRVLEDGRVAWLPDGVDSELFALPESLIREQNDKL
jgi:hypothetical protein